MVSTFYIYYPVLPENMASARRAVMALFAELSASTGVSGRLARRRDDPHVWMEIYPHVANADVFEQVLRAAEICHGLDRLSGEGRITEVFIEDVLNPGLESGETACA